MNRKPILIAVLVLALVSMACGINIDLPEEVKTGPKQVEPVSIPLPADPQLVTDLTLSFAGGKLHVGAGAEAALVDGTVTYNVPDFKPEISISGNNVRMTQGDLTLRGIPNFEDTAINIWDLNLAAVPMDLHIKCGAYSGTFELGGLKLQRLTIADGASDVNLSFSSLNQTELDLFEYTTGASSVSMHQLANANIDSMTFRAGAGSYTLDFSGTLQRDMTVTIEAGISSITVVIPDGVRAEVDFEGGLSSVTTRGNWTKDENSYSLAGSGPVIRIIVKMAAGSLDLRSE